jgi:hypothetical protein
MLRRPGASAAVVAALAALTVSSASVAYASSTPPTSSCTGLACAGSAGGGEYVAGAESSTVVARPASSGGGTTRVFSVPVYNPCRWEQGPTAEEMLANSTDPRLQHIYNMMGETPEYPGDLSSRQGQAGHYYYGICTSGTWPGETMEQFFAYTDQFFASNPSYIWVADGDPPPAPPPLPPTVLMEYARASVRVPDLDVDRNPGGNAVVNLPTWFWLDENLDEEVSVTATSGPNWATVTVTRQTMSVSAPDAVQQGSCASGGQAYDTSQSPSAQSTDCALQFHRSSARLGGAHPVTVSTGWTASWTGSDGSGGTLEGTTQSTTVDVPVSEIQTVVTR